MHKLSRSEAGKIGAAKLRANALIRRKEKIDEYDKNPKLCKCCSSKIEFEKPLAIFCSRSCAASFNNRKDQKFNSCKCCQKPTSNKSYCDKECYEKHKYDLSLENKSTWSHRKLKRFLLKDRGHSCEMCKNSEWMSVLIPLDMDHIDGDATNNDLSNVRLICPNCHALTETYKGRNKGNGKRLKRNQRYQEGKSY
jgi:hypothetical protein